MTMQKRSWKARVAVIDRSTDARQAVQGQRRLRIARHEIFFVLPAVSFIIIFFFIPNALNFMLSLTDWSSYKSTIEFVGLDNFVELYRTGELWNAISVTFRFAIFTVIIETIVALGLALALQESTPLNIVLRLICFCPVLLSALATGYLFRYYLQPDGILNSILNLPMSVFRLPPLEVEWLGSTTYTVYVVAAVHTWKYFGYHMLIYIAGLQAIPVDLTDAAQVEGANVWQRFRHVTIPLLGPAFTFNITTNFVGALTVFDVVLALTRGGPGLSTEVLNMVVFRFFGRSAAFGYATAVSTVLLIIVLSVAIPLIAYLRRREIEL